MRALDFLRDLFRCAPGVISIVEMLMTLVAALDALAVLSVAPLVDLIRQTGQEQAGGFTQRFAARLPNASGRTRAARPLASPMPCTT